MINPEPNSIYRTPNCSFADKAIKLLDEHGVKYHDHILSTPEEVEEVKSQYHVKTTPQIFLEGQRVGGYEELATRYGEEMEHEETSYVPVIAVFSVALLLSIAIGNGIMGFMGFSLSLLATLKLMDLESFQSAFKKYDLVTQKWSPYGKVYPFLELFAGLTFLSGFVPALGGLVALFAGSAGMYSIYQAVYVEKRDLNCACIGGGSKAPLGFVSMSENIIMAIMGAWLLFS